MMSYPNQEQAGGHMRGKKYYLLLIFVFTFLMMGMTVSAKIEITEENFDYKEYADAYPDVKEAYGYNKDLLFAHFQNVGRLEGRVAYTTDDSLNMQIYKESIIDTETNENMTEREKVKAIHDWMVYWLDYDIENYRAGTIPESSYTVDGVLKTDVGVCQGYALTFQEFMNMLGIECLYVRGTADNGKKIGRHAWNQVKVDGQWYNIDVTWDDPYGRDADEDGIRTTYFLISNEEMNRNHFPEVPIHDC